METKNSGNNITYEWWCKRESKEWKVNYTLIPYHQIKKLAELFTRWGAIYWNDNWKNGLENEEYTEKMKESALRHMYQFLMWEEDEAHDSAVIFNLMCYSERKRLLSLKSNQWKN